VLLVDADQHAREGLRRACDAEWPLEVVGEAGSVVEALAELDRLSPDVLASDVGLTDGDGFTLTRRARAAHPDLVIVLLAVNASSDNLFAALDAGASACLSKDRAAEEIAAAAWHAIVSPRMFPAGGPAGVMKRRLQTLSVSQLSPREYEVLLLLANGLDIPRIGRRLFIRESTAETHVTNVHEKLGVADRDQAVMTAVRLGLIRGDGGG
jgi:DNA-binding NarL/FixJ family response regulator